jgi:hypothetical protein
MMHAWTIQGKTNLLRQAPTMLQLNGQGEHRVSRRSDDAVTARIDFANAR